MKNINRAGARTPQHNNQRVYKYLEIPQCCPASECRRESRRVADLRSARPLRQDEILYRRDSTLDSETRAQHQDAYR